VKASQSSILNRFMIAFDWEGKSLFVRKFPEFRSQMFPPKYTSSENLAHQGFLISYPQWSGLKSANQWRLKGISYNYLFKKRTADSKEWTIFPFHNVFPPTKACYLKLFKQAIRELHLLQEIPKDSKTTTTTSLSCSNPMISVMDVGCGTGVLALILCEIAKRGQLLKIDYRTLC